MGRCYNCEREFTLKEEELKCDSCGEVVNYPCHSCKGWFSIYDEERGIKIKECSVCGYFVCPECGVCGEYCQTNEWATQIKKIVGSILDDAQLKKLLELIEEIKISKDQKCCIKGVPISYAKNRIKLCIVRMKGYRNKDEEDMVKFKERLETLLNKPLGTILTINQSREKGSYGQEFRDVFNYCICLGMLERVKIKKLIDGEEIEFWAYKRVEKGECPYLDLKDLVVKVCKNKECKIKLFPLSQTQCCHPECKYKKGKKKGQFYELKLKISNKDICQLERGLFKKEEDGGR